MKIWFLKMFWVPWSLLTFREFKKSDGRAYFALIKVNKRHLYTFARSVSTTCSTLGRTKRYIESSIKKKNYKLIGIWHLGVLIGSVDISFEKDGCEIGLWIAEQHSQRGFATKMTRAVVRYIHVFHPKIEIIIASTDHRNAASKRVLEKAGFVLVSDDSIFKNEGRSKGHLYVHEG
ncbi:MAG: GNAT family N-acetyltransferase [Patescibacteria group bacterium]